MSSVIYPAIPGAFTSKSPRRTHRLRDAIEQGAMSAAAVALLTDVALGAQPERALTHYRTPAWARPAMEAAHG